MSSERRDAAQRRFVKRVQTHEAVQFTGTPESCSEVTDFLGGPMSQGHSWNLATTTGGYLKERKGSGEWVPRSDGSFSPGCWLVRESGGRVVVYRDEDFRRIFEEVEVDG